MPIPEQATIDGIMAFIFVAGLLLFFGGIGLVKIEKVIISGSKFVWMTGIIYLGIFHVQDEVTFHAYFYPLPPSANENCLAML